MKKRISFAVEEEVYLKAKEFLGKLGHLPILSEIAFWHFLRMSEEEKAKANADFHYWKENGPQRPRFKLIRGDYEIPA